MPKLEYFLVAESVSVDQSTNRISFFNVVEQVNAKKFPSNILQIIAVAAWNAEEGDNEEDFQVAVRVTSPGGEPKDFRHSIAMRGKRSRVLLTFQGIVLNGAGTLLLELSLNGEHQATHSIDVVQAEDEPAGP